MNKIKLTAYSHGAGCGCKISPANLEKILGPNTMKNTTPSLLVGHDTKDDAAVYDLHDGTCVMSTIDFFTPIVDDPFVYGGIASSNAISDIYAMGGNPIMAVAVLGWPVDKIPLAVANEILEGSRDMCRQANIPIAGGHSIDTAEPIFGLAVTGKILKENLKQNCNARIGSSLYLTKPLGVGIITTAHKKSHVHEAHMQEATQSMLTLNKLGTKLGGLSYINAMTDVTGFGLLGHLRELCDGSHLSAEIDFDKIPVFDFLEEYIQPENIPGGTHRNWESYSQNMNLKNDFQKWILADPQTSGGLLISVDSSYTKNFEQVAAAYHMNLTPFGKLVKREEVSITIK